MEKTQSRKKCRICADGMLRLMIVEMSDTMSPYQITKKLRKERNIVCAAGVIERHLKEHERVPQIWTGMVRVRYNSQEEREKFEQGFLSRISFAIELYDKYLMMSDLLDMVIGDSKDPNAFAKSEKGVAKVVSLAGQMHTYLSSLMGLQSQKQFVAEFAKVLLFTMGEGLIDRLKFVLSDLPVEKREMVGKIIREEIQKGLAYSRGFNKEKVNDLIHKAQQAYDELVARVGEKGKEKTA